MGLRSWSLSWFSNRHSAKVALSLLFTVILLRIYSPSKPGRLRAMSDMIAPPERSILIEKGTRAADSDLKEDFTHGLKLGVTCCITFRREGTNFKFSEYINRTTFN